MYLAALPAALWCTGLEAPPAPDLGELYARWPSALERAALLEGKAWSEALDLAALPIDQAVGPVEETLGGWSQGRKRLERFLDLNLGRYGDGRNEVEDESASGLSPYLHWGHTGSHELFAELREREGWSPERTRKPNGKREGFWGMSVGAEAFMDQFLTWRELGFNRCAWP